MIKCYTTSFITIKCLTLKDAFGRLISKNTLVDEKLSSAFVGVESQKENMKSILENRLIFY